MFPVRCRHQQPAHRHRTCRVHHHPHNRVRWSQGTRVRFPLPRLGRRDRRVRPPVTFLGLGRKGRRNDTSIRSVAAALCGIADGIVEESGRTRPTGPRTVRTECAYIRDTENVWSFSQGVADIADELYELESMVKRLTGEHRPKKIGECPSLLDTGDECGTPLFAPVFGDTIKCRGCRREWARAEWLRLGTLLNLDDVA